MTTLKQTMELLNYKSTNIKSIDARLFLDFKRDTATAYLKINGNPVELVVGFKDVIDGEHECHNTSVKLKGTKQPVTGISAIIWAPVEDVTDNWQLQIETSDGLEKIMFHLEPVSRTIYDKMTLKGGLVAQGKWKYVEPELDPIDFNQWIVPTNKVRQMLNEMHLKFNDDTEI